MEHLWVAEYSPIQNAFHLELMDSMVETNKAMLSGSAHKATDFVVFAVGTREHCTKECDALEKIIRG